MTDGEETGATASRAEASAVLDVAFQAASAYQRADLGERLAGARRRLDDPSFHVLVVGEFKQGKSSLINALLDVEVCPVDDDVATAVPTLLRWSETPSAIVHLQPPEGAPPDTEPTSETVAVDDVHAYITEAANPANARRVHSVELGVPAELLRSGLVLVDTPGVGGLGSAHSTITIGALPMADAVLFVSDAAQEYSGPELEFLETARSLCPNVACAMTKIDFYPAWRKILELDQTHLAEAGVSVPVLAVSSPLRQHATLTSDNELDVESGFPALVEHLQHDVVGRSEELVVRTAVNDILSVVTQLESQFTAERNALADPEGAGRLVLQLERAKEQADRLRSNAARWQITLNDGFTDLSTEIDHDLRNRLRQLTKDADDAVDANDPAEAWAEFEPWLERQAAEQVVANYRLLHVHAADIAGRVGELFATDGHEIAVQLEIPNPGDVLREVNARVDVALEGGDGIGAGMTALRGSYGGLIMFGMLGQMVGLALINPVGMVAGLLFGGKAYRDEKNRALAMRRSQAKNAHRKYTDELAFAVAKESRDTIRQLQRQLRDHFSTRAEELHRSTAEALLKAQEAVATSERNRAKRLPDVEAELARIRGLRAEVLALDPSIAGGSGG